MANEIKIGDPGPLGLAGFGITTCILSLVNAGVLEATSLGVVLALAVAYGGGAQILAGMWEFRKGNTFGATAFTSYGAFWISFYLIVKAAPAAQGVGTFLLFFGIFTFFLWIGTFYVNRALFLIFLVLTVTFFLLALGEFGIISSHIGGWLGLVTGLLAIYTSAATVINETAGHTVLPIGKPIIKATNSTQKLSA